MSDFYSQSTILAVYNKFQFKRFIDSHKEGFVCIYCKTHMEDAYITLRTKCVYCSNIICGDCYVQNAFKICNICQLPFCPSCQFKTRVPNIEKYEQKRCWRCN